MKISRKALAVAAAASLTLGVAACSEAEDQANKAGDAASSAANDATEKAGEAAGDAKKGAEDKAAEITGAEGEDAEAEGAEGSEELPADIQTLWDNEGGKEGPYGDVTSVESNDNGDTLAQFEGGQYVVYSEANGAVPVIGMIGQTWADGGALDNEIGLPTAPEQGTAEEGWTQSFTNGTIEWSNKDGSGFAETITPN